VSAIVQNKIHHSFHDCYCRNVGDGDVERAICWSSDQYPCDFCCVFCDGSCVSSFAICLCKILGYNYWLKNNPIAIRIRSYRGGDDLVHTMIPLIGCDWNEIGWLHDENVFVNDLFPFVYCGVLLCDHVRSCGASYDALIHLHNTMNDLSMMMIRMMIRHDDRGMIPIRYSDDLSLYIYFFKNIFSCEVFLFFLIFGKRVSQLREKFYFFKKN
jgi:hypothetical protein